MVSKCRTEINEIEKGKRYWWYMNNVERKVKSGLFTGEYSKNGNARLITKAGDVWAIPVDDLFVK